MRIDVAKLFASDDERKCQASPYSISKKVYHNNTGCIWWLRSPGAGNYSFVVSHVDYDGKINIYGSEVQYTDYGVSPAIWLNIERSEPLYHYCSSAWIKKDLSPVGSLY